MVMPSKTNPSIVVEYNGRFLVWTDGALSGDPEYVKMAKQSAKYHELVYFDYSAEVLTASLDDPNDRLGAVVAMLSINPGLASAVELDDETSKKLYTLSHYAG